MINHSLCWLPVVLLLGLPWSAAAQRSYNRWQIPTVKKPKPGAELKRAKPSVSKAAATKPVSPAEMRARLGVPDSAQAGGKMVPIYIQHMPEYRGGMEALMQYMRKNLQHPKGKRLSGDVQVTFTVLANGSISNAYVKPGNGLDPRYDAAAVDFVSRLTGFTGGKIDGKPADTELTMPVTFR